MLVESGSFIYVKLDENETLKCK